MCADTLILDMVRASEPDRARLGGYTLCVARCPCCNPRHRPWRAERRSFDVLWDGLVTEHFVVLPIEAVV